MAKVYVVIEEGYQADYGSYPYLIGVFHDEEMAKKIATVENSVNPNEPRTYFEIEADTEFPLTKWDCDQGGNDYPLGGYAE